MVPEAEFTSYYGRPVLKPPHWRAQDIAGYFFLGGVAAGSSLLGAGADLTGRRELARVGRIAGLAAISGSTVALVHDLGRRDRFHHMLRVVKPTSPMSVGTWLLAAYGPMAGLAGATELVGVLPRLGRYAGYGAAAVAPGIATYTGVLLADTAVPAWHAAYPDLPFVFAGSAAAAAGGLGMLAAPVGQAGPARLFAAMGTAIEAVAATRAERRGLVSEPYRTGRGGALLRAAQILSAGGTVLGLALGRRSRPASMLAGSALIASSVCARFGVFYAGVESARDPKYTVVPQRERVDRNEPAADG
jgi:formate-dependent nitrite reductase membrane component NrfD